MSDDDSWLIADGKTFDAKGEEIEFTLVDKPEQWPMLYDQEALYPGDAIKKCADGRIMRVHPRDCTHTLMGVDNGIAYAMKKDW